MEGLSRKGTTVSRRIDRMGSLVLLSTRSVAYMSQHRHLQWQLEVQLLARNPAPEQYHSERGTAIGQCIWMQALQEVE